MRLSGRQSRSIARAARQLSSDGRIQQRLRQRGIEVTAEQIAMVRQLDHLIRRHGREQVKKLVDKLVQARGPMDLNA